MASNDVNVANTSELSLGPSNNPALNESTPVVSGKNGQSSNLVASVASGSSSSAPGTEGNKTSLIYNASSSKSCVKGYISCSTVSDGKSSIELGDMLEIDENVFITLQYVGRPKDEEDSRTFIVLTTSTSSAKKISFRRDDWLETVLTDISEGNICKKPTTLSDEDFSTVYKYLSGLNATCIHRYCDKDKDISYPKSNIGKSDDSKQIDGSKRSTRTKKPVPLAKSSSVPNTSSCVRNLRSSNNFDDNNYSLDDNEVLPAVKPRKKPAISSRSIQDDDEQIETPKKSDNNAEKMKQLERENQQLRMELQRSIAEENSAKKVEPHVTPSMLNKQTPMSSFPDQLMAFNNCGMQNNYDEEDDDEFSRNSRMAMDINFRMFVGNVMMQNYSRSSRKRKASNA